MTVDEEEIVIEEEKLKPIHPGIDIVDGKAYIGHWKDCVFKTARGAKKRVRLLYLIREDGEKIPYLPDYLAEHGLRPLYAPVEMENWWLGEIVDVDPKEVYEEVEGNYRTFIEMKDEEYAVASLWAIGTYFHVIFNSYPYLYISGVKRTGKTKTLHLTKLISYNGVLSHNMSTSTLYRLVQNARCSLFMDEVERLSDPKAMKEFRCLLLGGYKKGSSVYRTEKTTKEKLIPTRFNIYGPKALANISGMDDVLEDRTITIIMERSLDKDIVDTDFDEQDRCWMELRTRLASLFFKYHREVRMLYEGLSKAFSREKDYSALPEELRGEVRRYRDMLSSRNREVWAPILTMALFFEKYGVGGLVDRIMKVAKIDISERLVEDTVTPEAILAESLLDIYDPAEMWYPVSALAERFKEKMGLSKADPRAVGRMLRRLGLRNKRKVSGYIEYMVTEADARRIALKYLGMTEEELERKLKGMGEAEAARADEARAGAGSKEKKTVAVAELSGKVRAFLMRFGPCTRTSLRAFLVGAGVDPIAVDDYIEGLKDAGAVTENGDGSFTAS